MPKTHTFASWLQQEIDRRGWDQAQAAREIKVRGSTVSMWLRKGVIPETASCLKIALALEIDVDEVLSQAGLDGPLKGKGASPTRMDREAAILLRNDRYRRVLRKIARRPIDEQEKYLDIIDRILGDEDD